MSRVVALDLPGGPAFVDALRRVWDDGDAAFVVDRRLAPPARAAVMAAVAPAAIVDDDGAHAIAGGRPAEPGDALVVATSGTTGTPRAVVLTHDAVAASARASAGRLGTGAADHWLACLPLAHVGGLSVVCRALVTGSRLTVHPAFDPAAAEDAARRDGVTAVSLVATALRRVDASVFRVILLGGAAPPPVLPPNVVVTYGMTETGSGVVYDGVPVDGAEVALDDDGGIRVRGPMLLRAYRDGSDPKDADGWLATGDVGSFGADGRLRVHGRRGDLIITGGENVWPDAVEPVLASVPGVAEVAVAGVPDEEWGHRVVAFVVPADPASPPTLAALRAVVRERLAAHAAPKQLVLTGSLPRTALGKVRRAELAASAPPLP